MCSKRSPRGGILPSAHAGNGTSNTTSTQFSFRRMRVPPPSRGTMRSVWVRSQWNSGRTGVGAKVSLRGCVKSRALRRVRSSASAAADAAASPAAAQSIALESSTGGAVGADAPDTKFGRVAGGWPRRPGGAGATLVLRAGGAAGLGSQTRTDVRSGEASACGRVRDNSPSSTAMWAAATAARVGRRLAARPVRT